MSQFLNKMSGLNIIFSQNPLSKPSSFNQHSYGLPVASSANFLFLWLWIWWRGTPRVQKKWETVCASCSKREFLSSLCLLLLLLELLVWRLDDVWYYHKPEWITVHIVPISLPNKCNWMGAWAKSVILKNRAN